VRCGSCLAAFSALEYLLDEGLIGSLADPDNQSDQSDLVDPGDSAKKDTPRADPEEQAAPIAAVGSENTHATAVAPRYHLDDEAAYLLFDKLPARSHRRRTAAGFLWGGLAFIFALLLTGQLAWFNQKALFANFSELRPPLVRVCKGLNCNLPDLRPPPSYKVLARDVREHPSYSKTLLVNATLLNDTKIHYPYPYLQLSLYDPAGAVIGERRFDPLEYLDASVDVQEEMPPGVPVFIVLEIVGPTDQAVSFEFSFL